jgi:hypothetical protein
MRRSALVLVCSLLEASSFRVGPPTCRSPAVTRRACSPVRMDDDDVDKSEVWPSSTLPPKHAFTARAHVACLLAGLDTSTDLQYCTSHCPLAHGQIALEAVMDAEDKMKKSISKMRESLSTLRVGRASPSLLDRVMVDYYETPTPLNQLASVSAPTPSQLVIDVYDKSSMGDVEKALMMSDLGMTPSNDGKVIRLNVPQLTAERRKVRAARRPVE